MIALISMAIEQFEIAQSSCVACWLSHFSNPELLLLLLIVIHHLKILITDDQIFIEAVSAIARAFFIALVGPYSIVLWALVRSVACLGRVHA